MGEIQQPRHVFLYELKYWEINAIVRGYRRRQEFEWERSRWMAFFSMVGTVKLKDAGINTPSDLLPLPHDVPDIPDGPTDDEIEMCVQEMNRINSERAKE